MKLSESFSAYLLTFRCTKNDFIISLETFVCRIAYVNLHELDMNSFNWRAH